MFKTIQDLTLYLKKHPTKRYAFRDTSTIDKIVIHQTDSEDMGEFSPYYTANYHVDTRLGGYWVSLLYNRWRKNIPNQ